MPRKKILTVREPERGLVPSRAVGRLDVVYGAYLTELNPRGNDHVQMALAASPDPRFKEFLERVNMPRYRHISLQTIAKACNITLAEFNNWWQKASTQRAIAVAQTKSVIITEDMAQDARSRDEECPRCEGLRFIAAPLGLPKEVKGYRCIAKATGDEPERWIRDCPKCNAEGTVRSPGDQHSRDKILEMSGLVKKGAAVNITQNFGGASHSSAITELDEISAIDI